MRLSELYFATFTLFCPAIGWSQAVDDTVKTSDERMEFMHRQAASFQGTILQNEEPERTTSLKDEIQAFHKPLLRWSNPHTNIRDGVLVCWVDHAGVPSAAAQICLTPNSLDQWAIEFQSLSQKPLTLTNGVIEVWRPATPGVQWHSLGDHAEPSQKESQRLVQMRGIARRFRGDDDFENEESTLRLLTNPLLRYDHPKAGIIDGAMFALVQGTDPEMLILIEVHKGHSSPPTFRWALAPMTSFELKGYLDRDEVWHKPKMTSNLPTDIFFQRLLIGGKSQEQPLSDRLRSLLGF